MAKISFDIIGDVAVIEMRNVQKNPEKKIIGRIRKTHPHIKTILKKQSGRTGEYRIRKFKKLFGKETETVHKEHGMQFRLDVARAYFSPRESTERQRIAGLVKPGETVLVMFAGTGPYAVAIAKRQPKVKKVYAVEINPAAAKYMEKNVRINRVGDKTVPILGDAKEKIKKLGIKFDRVVMPLPLEAGKFLPAALECLKKRGIIHFYSVGPEEDMFSDAEKRIKKACEKAGVKFRIISRKKVLPYGPRMHKVCIDFLKT